MGTDRQSDSSLQVLVAGAGPVGLTLAGELARLGAGVRIVDKCAVRSDKSKALVVWTRTLELMRIMGCADAFVHAGLRVTHAALRSGEQELARAGFGQLQSPYPFGILLPQSDTERLLEERLEGLGVRVERNTELTAFAADAAGVTSTLRCADGGGEERLRSDWLVGCDGAHSTVRHGLGFAFEGETEPNDWLLADVHLDGPVPDAEVMIFLHRSGVLALFPMGGTRYRVIADMGPRSAAPAAAPTLRDVQALIDARGPRGVKADDPVWLTHFGINERKVREYRAGRVFVAGDAAHIHSPAGGQGMNTGIQDAVNLAWKLALVCRGSATAASPLLASYGPERSAVAAHVLRGAAALTRMGTLRNPAMQRLRNLVVPMFMRLPAVRRGLATMLGELDIAYRDSLLSRRAASARTGIPRPGERLPDHAIRTLDGKPATLYETLHGGRFLALTARADVESEQAAEVLSRFGDVCAIGVDEEFGGSLIVVRPDGYLGLLAGPHDWNAVAGYLEDVLASAGR